MAFEPTKHAVLRIPGVADVLAAARAYGVSAQESYARVHREREALIQRMEHDPLRYGWEPSVWKVCDALLGMEKFGLVDAGWARRLRKRFGYEERVRLLLILGGNRSGKSEYCAKRMMYVLNHVEGAMVWPFHSTAAMSVEYQHKLMWKYLPPEFRRFVRSEVEYIAYKQKTGFSDNKFVLVNGSECSFRNYAQERDDAIEGGEVDAFWDDELVPPDWVETQMLRIATRDGFGLVSFTPVQGYSPTVRLFQDGADTVLESTCFLLPKDGKGVDVARALGFENEEAMREAHEHGCWSAPEDFNAWMEGEKRQPAPDAGRVFETMPRVMRCFNRSAAIVFFYSSDNPFGNPKNVAEMVVGRSAEFVRERFYGWAAKTMSSRFPRFNRKVHVVPAADVPTSGMRVMVLDPASGRNFFMKWYILTAEGVFLYREWPGGYSVPGVGVPGPWALPDGKRLDGRPGEGQRPFGWGLLRYKEEIARLEGWRPLSAEEMRLDRKRQALVDWTDAGAREVMAARIVDSRAASSPRVENDRPRTLLTDFEDINLFFELAPGEEIDEGVTMINSALDYDPEAPLDFFNKPHYFISDECANSIFAMETWTGDQGNKGATKDPIDCDRYLFLSDLDYLPEAALSVRGGGYY